MAEDEHSVRLEFYTSMVRKDLQSGILVISGAITEDIASIVGRELREIVRLRGSGPITVMLFSGGGGVYPAFCVYDLLRGYSAEHGPVRVIASGMALSAAAGIILQAGDNRQATPSTRLMLHEVGMWFGTGTSMLTSAAEDQTKEMRTLQGMIYDILSQRSGKTREHWEAAMSRREVWYTADEALRAGLIDSVATGFVATSEDASQPQL